MPYIKYISADAGAYTSAFDVNVGIDSFLAKMIGVKFDSYGVKVLQSSPENVVDLHSLVEVGNYVIHDFIDGPPNLTYVYPIHVWVYKVDDVIYQCIPHMLDIYYRIHNEESYSWTQWSTIESTNCPLFYGTSEPDFIDTPYALWIDTSLSGYPVIKGYTKSTGWFGVGSLIDTMNAIIYDTTNKFTDIFKYFEEMIGMIRKKEDGSYEIINKDDASMTDKVYLYNIRAKFLNHHKMGHMTQEEYQLFIDMISKDEFAKLVETTIDLYIKYINESIEALNLVVMKEVIVDESNRIINHDNDDSIHTEWSKQLYWTLKSNADHIHNLEKWNTISGEDILEGTIDIERMPPEAIEVMKRVLTHNDRFTKFTYEEIQNGDSVYVSEETEEYEAGLYLVYDHYNLDNDKGWLYYRTRRIANIDYEDIIRRPTTLAGYGITDGTLVIKDENGKFIYPYQTEDNTMNYYTNKRVNEYYAHVTKILDEIEYKMTEQEAETIWDQANSNTEEYLAIKGVWDRYRRINGNHIPVQHDLNMRLYNEIISKYNHIYSILYHSPSEYEKTN